MSDFSQKLGFHIDPKSKPYFGIPTHNINVCKLFMQSLFKIDQDNSELKEG